MSPLSSSATRSRRPSGLYQTRTWPMPSTYKKDNICVGPIMGVTIGHKITFLNSFLLVLWSWNEEGVWDRTAVYKAIRLR
ncbi:hypothetical protein DL98DRAFT_53773 [Cadophora sp. DSE1049]|nr:hypothetical protein DL98DRAFT_53773 [Cadophora sp. DSE1049]